MDFPVDEDGVSGGPNPTLKKWKEDRAGSVGDDRDARPQPSRRADKNRRLPAGGFFSLWEMS